MERILMLQNCQRVCREAHWQTERQEDIDKQTGTTYTTVILVKQSIRREMHKVIQVDRFLSPAQPGFQTFFAGCSYFNKVLYLPFSLFR